MGILHARTLEWVAMPASRGSAWPRDRTCVSCIGRWIFYDCAEKELLCDPKPCPNYSHEKIILGSWLQLLLTELYEILSAGLLCTIGTHSVPPHQGLGQAVRLLLLLLPLLLLFLSCPQQGHVFEAGHSVPLRWLFGPFVAAVPPVLAQSSCWAPAHILPTEPSAGWAPFSSGRLPKPHPAVPCDHA